MTHHVLDHSLFRNFLCGSTHNIVKLEVSVDDRVSVSRQIPHHKIDNLVKVFVSTAEKLARFDVPDSGLLLFDSGEGSAVPLIEPSLLPETLEAY